MLYSLYLTKQTFYNQSKNRQMESLLLKQFTQGMKQTGIMRYLKIFGHKNPKVLNSVIPSLTQNLKSSSETLIEAVVDQDKQFIESVASKALQKVLLAEVEKWKNGGISMKMVDIKMEEFKETIRKDLEEKEEGKEKVQLVSMIVSPYIIFGQKIEDRNQSENPWSSCVPLCSNRFIYKDPAGISLRKLIDQQIYGFNCTYKSYQKGYQITEGLKVSEFKPKQFVVTFETDADKHEFFATDFNYLVRYP